MYRMEDGRIPKDLLYGELESGSRPIGRPKLRFKDVCKRDMLATGLPTDNWELHAADRSDWRSVCSLALQAGEERLKAEAVDRRAKRGAEMNKQWHVSLCAVDAALSSVLELGFLAMRESVCRNCASHGHGRTTAYYCLVIVHVQVCYALLIKNFWQFRSQDLKHTETGLFLLLHLNSGMSCH